MHQVAIKPLYEGQVRPQDFAWFENEYGYWFGYAIHPARELAKRSGTRTWRTSTRRTPKQTARLAEPDDS
jgi:hypothetical protein